MSLIEPLLQRLTDRLPCRIINGEQGEPYLERYYLVGVAGWHCYLHRFVDSDPDRGLHDHPWSRAASLVLTGGYQEIRFAGTDRSRTSKRLLRPGGLNLLRGETYHRVVLVDGPAWTLFIHGPRAKGWGFLRNGIYSAMAEDAATFRHRDWWKTAPKGRALRRLRANQAAALAAAPGAERATSR